MTELRKRMIEDMQLAGLSQGTQETYVREKVPGTLFRYCQEKVPGTFPTGSRGFFLFRF